MPRRTVLFTSSFTSTFILEDLEILRRSHTVSHVLTRGVAAPVRILRVMPRHSVSFTWFASMYAFAVVLIARILGKPSIVVLAGADLADRPDLGYGAWRHPWKRIFLRWTLRNASRCLAVDPSLQERAQRLGGYDGANIRIVPTGYDPEVWFPGGSRERSVLTIAVCEAEPRLRVKGIDLLWEAARMLPDVPFIIIGVQPDLAAALLGERPANLTIMPPVPRGELRPFYQRSAVYCQPSRSEGLPNSLCEAMLCGCFPVGTAVGGVPNAIGDAGVIVPPDDAARLVDGLATALRTNPAQGEHARQRILRLFPLRKREESLLSVIAELRP